MVKSKYGFKVFHCFYNLTFSILARLLPTSHCWIKRSSFELISPAKKTKNQEKTKSPWCNNGYLKMQKLHTLTKDPSVSAFKISRK